MEDSVAFQRAAERLHAGNPLEAEGMLVETARAAERALGPRSALHASAQFELAKLRLLLGDVPRALEALRIASELEPATPSEQKARLTYLMNLGELLERAGDLDAAENVLRQGLGERATFYGVEHPGYAFGLEPLAALKLARGRATEARCLAEQALHILLEAQHPRLAALVALRAYAVVAEGNDDPYRFSDQLDPVAFAQMVHAVLDRAEYSSPAHALAALVAVRPLINERLGTDHDLLLHVMAAISNRARDLGDHPPRIEAFAWIIAALDARGDRSQALDAVLGLALAESDRGNPEPAEAHYRDALERASAVSQPARSKVLRNFGLFLAGIERRSEAEAMLMGAVDEARQSSAREMLGRALVALGIFHQHGGDARAARICLAEGLRALPSADSDALCGKSHLDALERGSGCGCGNMQRALSEALRELVEPNLPAGLLASLTLDDGDDGSVGLCVELAREPSPGERELLERVIGQGLAKLRREIRRGE